VVYYYYAFAELMMVVLLFYLCLLSYIIKLNIWSAKQKQNSLLEVVRIIVK